MIFKFCLDCGYKIEAAFNFCPFCGCKIPKQEPAEEVQPVPAQSTASPGEMAGSILTKCRRTLNFSEDDVTNLLNEVEARRSKIVGTPQSRAPRKQQTIAWAEIAEAVSATSRTTRSMEQCRKKLSDMLRIVKNKKRFNHAELSKTGGGTAFWKELTEHEERVNQLYQFADNCPPEGLERGCGSALAAERGEWSLQSMGAEAIAADADDAESVAVTDVEENQEHDTEEGEEEPDEIVAFQLMDIDKEEIDNSGLCAASAGPSGPASVTSPVSCTQTHDADTAVHEDQWEKNSGDEVLVIDALEKAMCEMGQNFVEGMCTLGQQFENLARANEKINLKLEKVGCVLDKMLTLGQQFFDEWKQNQTPTPPPLTDPSAETVEARETAAASVHIQQECQELIAEGQQTTIIARSSVRVAQQLPGRGRRRKP